MVKVNVKPKPSDISVFPVTTRKGEFVLIWVIRNMPKAAIASPPATTSAGRTRGTSFGARLEPKINESAAGTDHKPAFNGERPSTNCRYWAMNRKPPKLTKMPSVYVASDALKAGTRNNFRSINGETSDNRHDRL